MKSAKPLQGLGVVVTRPAHQAQPLCERLSALGANVIRFPLMQIKALALTPAQQQILEQLEQYDLAIFVSPNAVTFGLQRLDGHWPAKLKIAAVGQGSAKALRQQQQHVDLFPTDQFNSEALLVLPELQRVQQQRIVIFRGQGGREYLAQELRKRGAEVDYLELYQRLPPTAKIDTLLKLWQQNQIQLIIITSSESLHNLYAMVASSGKAYLENTPLLVISTQTKRLALKLGFKNLIMISPQASDIEISNTLIKHTDSMTLDRNHE